MTYKYIDKKNYSEKIYEEFYNFFDKKVEKILKDLRNLDPKNECHVLGYGYEFWVEDTFEEAVEDTKYSIECEDIASDFHENLKMAFSLLEEEVEWHNEIARNEN